MSDNKQLSDFPVTELVASTDFLYSANASTDVEQKTTVGQLQSYVLSPISGGSAPTLPTPIGTETVPIGKAGLFQMTLTRLQAFVLSIIAQGASTDAGTLTGAETVPLGRGGNLLQTTTSKLAALVTGEMVPTVQSIPVLAAGQAAYVTQGYTPGIINVFVTGIRLNPSQYQALDGINITITDAAVLAKLAAGMTVDITAALSISVANVATVASVTALDPGNQPVASVLSGTELVSVRQGAGLYHTTTGSLVTLAMSGLVAQRQSIPVLTNNQSVYTTAGYTPGLANVFVAGIRISPDRYIALDGVTITITDATLIGDLTVGMTVDLDATISINVANVATVASVLALDPGNQPAAAPLVGSELTSFRQGSGLVHSTLTQIANFVLSMFQISSVTALRALPTVVFTKATTAGYHAPGDGGHGEYDFIQTSSPPADNGVTVFVTNDGRGYFSLEHNNDIRFEQGGAYGDALVAGGGHNDTAAIQAVINALAQNPADSRSITSATVATSKSIARAQAGRAYLCDPLFWRAGVSILCDGEALIVPSVAATTAAASFSGDAYTNTAIKAYDSAQVTGGHYAFMFNPQGITQTQKIDGVYVEGICINPSWNFATINANRPTVGGFDFSYMEKDWGAKRCRVANLAGTAFNFDDAQDANIDRLEALLCDNGRLVGSSQWNPTNAVTFLKMRLERNIYCNHISWNKGFFPPRGNAYIADKIEVGAEINTAMTHPTCLVLASDGEARSQVHDVPGVTTQQMWSIGFGGVGASIYGGFSISGGLAETPTGQIHLCQYLDTDATVADFTTVTNLTLNNMAAFAIKGNTSCAKLHGSGNQAPVLSLNDNIPQGVDCVFTNTSAAALAEVSQVFGSAGGTVGFPYAMKHGDNQVTAARVPTWAQLQAGLSGITQASPATRAQALLTTLATRNITAQPYEVTITFNVTITAGGSQTVEFLTNPNLANANNWRSRGVLTQPNYTGTWTVSKELVVLPGHYWGVVVNDSSTLTATGTVYPQSLN